MIRSSSSCAARSGAATSSRARRAPAGGGAARRAPDRRAGRPRRRAAPRCTRRNTCDSWKPLTRAGANCPTHPRKWWPMCTVSRPALHLSRTHRRPGRLSHGRYRVSDRRGHLGSGGLVGALRHPRGPAGAGRRARGLRAVPSARPPRLCRPRQRLLLPEQRRHRGPASARRARAGRRPGPGCASRQRHPGHLLPPRRRADRVDARRRAQHRRSSSATPTRPARATGWATTSTVRCRWAPATPATWRRCAACSWTSAYAPGALVVALGLDAHERDPYKGLAVTTEGFGLILAEVARLACPRCWCRKAATCPTTWGPTWPALRGFDSAA